MSEQPDKTQLHAYYATLFCIVLISISTLVAGVKGATISEAYGLAVVTGGLLALMKFPSQRSVTVANTPDNPVPTDPSDAK